VKYGKVISGNVILGHVNFGGVSVVEDLSGVDGC